MDANVSGHPGTKHACPFLRHYWLCLARQGRGFSRKERWLIRRRFLGFTVVIFALFVALALVPLAASGQTATTGVGSAATGTGTAVGSTGTAAAGTTTRITGTGTAAAGTGTAVATTAATTAATATGAATSTPAATGVGGAVATAAPVTTMPTTGHPSSGGTLNYALLAMVMLAIGVIGVGIALRRKAPRL